MRISFFWTLFFIVYTSHAAPFGTSIVYKAGDVVWGFDFLPEAKLLISEKEGALRILDTKTNKVQTIRAVPEVNSDGQGGLLDVLVDKNFKKNRKIYLTYSAPVKGGQTTRLASAQLYKNELKEIKILFTALPGTKKTHHFGSRVLQNASGDLFLTVGDRGERKLAQDKNQHRGKVYKISQDSQVELWSLGHRNAQGASIHPHTKEIWTVEHGPRGGDELNLISRGKNYGCPIITYGKEYWGPSIGEGKKKKGMEQPKYYFTPSIATSGLMIYSGKMFSEWKGHFFIGALKDRHISHLASVDGNITEVEKLFEDNKERIRQIKEASDGSIYYSTDNGKIIRLFKKLKGES